METAGEQDKGKHNQTIGLKGSRTKEKTTFTKIKQELTDASHTHIHTNFTLKETQWRPGN